MAGCLDDHPSPSRPGEAGGCAPQGSPDDRTSLTVLRQLFHPEGSLGWSGIRGHHQRGEFSPASWPGTLGAEG